jgi:hypothetical protein
MAKCGITNISGGGGVGSDELSTTKKQVLKGKTYVGADTNDEIGVGELDLDVITVTSPDMLAGKVGVDKGGNPINGTMVNNGTVNQSLAINGTYTIPAGYHNGQGKITQGITTMGAQTINPTASQQTVSSSGKYMTGNVVVNGVSNLTAANIKKGQTVGGTAGACDWIDASEANNFLGLVDIQTTTNYKTFSDIIRDRSRMMLLYDGVYKPQYTYLIFRVGAINANNIIFDHGYRNEMCTYKYSADGGSQLIYTEFYRINPNPSYTDAARLRIWAYAYSPAGTSDTPRVNIGFLGGTNFIG